MRASRVLHLHALPCALRFRLSYGTRTYNPFDSIRQRAATTSIEDPWIGDLSYGALSPQATELSGLSRSQQSFVNCNTTQWVRHLQQHGELSVTLLTARLTGGYIFVGTKGTVRIDATVWYWRSIGMMKMHRCLQKDWKEINIKASVWCRFSNTHLLLKIWPIHFNLFWHSLFVFPSLLLAMKMHLSCKYIMYAPRRVV